MVSSRELVVFDTYERSNLELPKKPNDVLPVVRSISGKEQGLIELEDGSLARIIKFNGFSIAYSEPDLKCVEEAFEKTILCLTKQSRIQFLVINRPIDAEKHMEKFRESCVDDNMYLTWYADYTSKWFQRYCEVTPVPRREFYAVVSVDPSAMAKQKRIDSLDRVIKRVCGVLNSVRQKPEILSRSCVRKLIYSCLRPSYPSGLSEEPVEVLNKSSLPKVPNEVTKDHVLLDDMKVSNLVVSDLPRNIICGGWLMSLVCLPFPTNVSVHARLGDSKSVIKNAESYPSKLKTKIEKQCSKSKALVELSIYFSTLAGTDRSEEILAHQIEQAKSVFEKENALLVANCNQKSAWISGLPLGIDAGGTAHCISIEHAGKVCPLYTASCGAEYGIPLGFAWSSREPVFLNASPESGIFALASNKKDLEGFQSIITLRLLSTNKEILFFDDGTGINSMLEEVLGPDVVNKISVLSPNYYLDDPEDLSLLTILNTGSKLSTDDIERAINEWIVTHRDSKREPVFLVGNLSHLCRTAKGLHLLEYIYKQASKNNVMVVTTALTSVSHMASKKAFEIACQNSEWKIVLPHGSKKHALVKRYLNLTDSELYAVKTMNNRDESRKDTLCFMTSDDGLGVVRVVPSPMDYWICKGQSHQDIVKLVKMKHEVKYKNNLLSNTDVARQSVYYLGLIQDG